jgi:hypothetical protein
LKATYTSEDDIPEQFRELYSVRDGTWEFTGVEGIQTEANLSRLETALNHEKENHKETKRILASFEGLKAEDVRNALHERDELKARVEAGLEGKVDEEKVNKLVEARVKSKTAQLERDLTSTTEKLTEATNTVGELQGSIRKTKISDAIRKAATSAKIVDTAVEDVLLMAERVFEVSEDGNVLVKDQVGFTPGLAPDSWLADMKDKRPHWWPANIGGDSRGGKGGAPGENPWSDKSWNLARQGEIYQNSPAKAAELAKAAGKPPPANI